MNEAWLLHNWWSANWFGWICTVQKENQAITTDSRIFRPRRPSSTHNRTLFTFCLLILFGKLQMINGKQAWRHRYVLDIPGHSMMINVPFLVWNKTIRSRRGPTATNCFLTAPFLVPACCISPNDCIGEVIQWCHSICHLPFGQPIWSPLYYTV